MRQDQTIWFSSHGIRQKIGPTCRNHFATGDNRNRTQIVHCNGGFLRSQPAFNKLRAATSTYHLMMKFPIEEGVGEVKGDQVAARKSYNISIKKIIDPTTLTVASDKGEPVEPFKEVVVGEGKILQIGTCLTHEIREGLVDFFRRNMEVFAWSHEYMPGISPEEIIHIPNVDPAMKLVKQKRRKFAPERVEAIVVEVEKLLKAQFIQEVCYPD